MKRFSLFLLFILVSVVPVAFASGHDEKKDTRAASDPRMLAVEDLRPGMKGIARTVFAGTEPQEFGVEILGVLPGFPGPHQSGIIARLSGNNVEKTGVFAGMSGSPVYIDGKLVGAIAFSFPFSKEPIAGITPIKEMIDIFEKGTGAEQQKAREPRAVSFAQLAGTEWKPALPKQAVAGAPFIASVSAGAPLIPFLGQPMTPIATPIVFGGISQETLSQFSSQLIANGLLPVAGVGGAAAITSLAPTTDKTLAAGTSVSVQLVRGDYSLAASGTVTFRDG